MNIKNFDLKKFLLQIWRQVRTFLAGMLLISLLVPGCSKQDVPTTTAPGMPAHVSPFGLAEGIAFPAVTLKTLSGESVPIQSLQGKMLILNVWATWCAPCRKEMPSLEHLSKTLDPQRFAVLGLSIDGDEILAVEFLRSNHISFRNYFDRNAKLSQQMGLEAYPQTFLIAQDGTLVKRVLGQQNWIDPGMIQMLESAYQLNHRTRIEKVQNR